MWYCEELDHRVGTDATTAYLDRHECGNRRVGEAVDRFWLPSELEVSAEAQIELLRQLYHNALGFPPATITAVKQMLILENAPGRRLSSKTGCAGFGDPSARQVGWFVRSMERSRSTSFLALNREIHQPEDARGRVARVREDLSQLGLME